METHFERKVCQDMLEWKTRYARYAPGYALFLKGARRVGKTTLALKLGREQYRSHILVRFDQAEESVKDLFVNSLRDLNSLFQTLQFAYGTRLYERESLVILDEIQLFPPARQALKTLLEDGRYDYLETGSLASIRKKSKDILIPSEEHQVDVLPMDFEEYLAAMGDDMTASIVSERFHGLKPLGGMHQKIMKTFREYMLVGGMAPGGGGFRRRQGLRPRRFHEAADHQPLPGRHGRPGGGKPRLRNELLRPHTLGAVETRQTVRAVARRPVSRGRFS